jgi:hypothetical protein
VIQRDAFREDISPSFDGIERHGIIAPGRLDGFGLNERHFLRG